MDKDTALFQLALLCIRSDEEIKSINRMKTGTEHKAALIADVRKQRAALEFAISAIKALQKCLEAANAHECKALYSGTLHEVVQEYARAAFATAKGGQ